MGVGQGPGRDHLTSPAGPIFDAYEGVRARLPDPGSGGACALSRSLADLAGAYDTFLLDAFGVLNVGETAIPGAPARIAALQAAGKRVLVVSNAAGLPHGVLMAKYARLGFALEPDDVITSRTALIAALAPAPRRRWAAMAASADGLESLFPDLLADDQAAYDAAEGFLLIGSSRWNEARQDLLEASLRANPRPVHCGNPDLAAPREGQPSREPGHWAHRLADRTGIEPIFHGKPFRGIYDLAFARLSNPGRILMVGDSLHTDILGAQVAGIDSALVTGHGILRGHDVGHAIAASGIRPDHILPDP
ncbi:MAG: HAD hydrolase-like protein [Jannaschia sp.]